MVDSVVIVKKSEKLLSVLKERYTVNGGFTETYYDTLEKGLDDNKPKPELNQNLKIPSKVPENQHQSKLNDFFPEAKKEPIDVGSPIVRQGSPVTRESPKPEEQIPMQSNNVAPVTKEPEVPKVPAYNKPQFSPEQSAIIAKYPGLEKIVKPSGDPLKNNWNMKAIEYIQKGDLTPEQIPLLQVILPKINNVRTIPEYFAAISELKRSPEIKNARGEDLLRHFVNSANVHIKMSDELKKEVSTVLRGKLVSSGLGAETAVGRVALNVVNKIPGDASIKELGIIIGREVSKKLGDVALPPQTEEQRLLREDAIRLNRELYFAFGVSTGLAANKVNTKIQKV